MSPSPRAGSRRNPVRTGRRSVAPVKEIWGRYSGQRSPARMLLHAYRHVAKLHETQRAYSPQSQLAAWGDTLKLLATPRKTVLCYPMRPEPYSVLYKLCTLAGYWITTDPEIECDAVFRWDDVTWSHVEPFAHQEAAINRWCTDVSKQYVSRVFTEVFGYDLMVDPTTYVGRVVKKSDRNATHDGEVIDCPIPPEDVTPGYVYQKAIDNRRDGADGFYEYRVPVLGQTLPVVYIKYRPADAQFKAFDGVEVVAPESVLSGPERKQILAFAEAMRMEYGELDVLRDRGDGRIYVVDANDTPSGPARGFRPEQSAAALRALQPGFEALVAESARRLAQTSTAVDGPAPR